MVNNASTDGSREIAATHPSRPKVVDLPSNAGYAGAIAAVLPSIDTPYMAWLNDDAVPAANWLSLLCAAVSRSADTGAASAQLVYSGTTDSQSVGVGLTSRGYGFDLIGLADGGVFGFCGAASVVRTSALRAVGGVPAEFFCYYEDTDTSWRLRLAGFDIVAVPEARVEHAHGASASLGSRDFHRWNERNRLLMLLRCAPLAVFLREFGRFVLRTLLLTRRRAQEAPNFDPRLRTRVVLELVRLLPRTLLARCSISAASTRSRRAVWRQWRGHPPT